MKAARSALSFWLAFFLLVACVAPGEQPDAPASPPPPIPYETTAPRTPVELTIFYTNDEHGWMEGMGRDNGAASMMAHWRAAGYETGGPYLVLSGGDMWTGPAISTWFEGEGMVEVMNGMGYAAAAVGNHEFDFGLDSLRARALESHFPLLSANTRTAEGVVPTTWGIEPYTVVEVAGIHVGVVGLTTVSTPFTTNPANLADLVFIDYETALRETIPLARADGAELLVVVGHLCSADLVALARQVGDLDIVLMGGGHCNERLAREVNGIILVEGGYHFTSYATVDLTFDPGTGRVLEATPRVVANSPAATPDPAIAAIVARWQARVAEELDVVVGYSEKGLPRESTILRRLVPATWLLAYPEADVALTNPGGFRAALPAGPLTFSDVVGVLPFNNVLVDVTLTGDELEQVLNYRDAHVAGAVQRGNRWLLDDGSALEPAATYHLLTIDYLYAGGDGYEMLARFDPDAYNTAIDWRQPLIDWIIAQESDQKQPLDHAWARLGGQ